MSSAPRVSRISRASREWSLFEGFPAVSAENPAARFLVLGSFPSVRSALKGEYYGHERNHFWPILFWYAGQTIEGRSYAEKCALAADLGIVIWDMVRSCRRTNSSDADLEVLELNDVRAFLAARPSISRIGLNGGLATTLFLGAIVARGQKASATETREVKQALSLTGGITRLWIADRECRVFRLPSTSPVPTDRFRTIDDKKPLWERFLRNDALENSVP